jgi:ligand-binding SRPBCC domain-containing protein
MPRFETTITIARPVAEVFEFFRRPANLLRVSPPELHLRLVEAPELVERGSRIVLQGRRLGIPQRLVSEITTLVPDVLLVDEQKEGPLRKWAQTHRFDKVPEGTRVTFQIDYEPPGGMLGFVVTAAAIDKELRWLFAYRTQKLHELLENHHV